MSALPITIEVPRIPNACLPSQQLSLIDDAG
jgi:hypothetical protein